MTAEPKASGWFHAGNPEGALMDVAFGRVCRAARGCRAWLGTTGHARSEIAARDPVMRDAGLPARDPVMRDAGLPA
ncbi:hypothetical protein, partial [Stenotrophomonas nematodicola]